MRLLDLDPRWVGINTIVVNRLRIGFTFLCPHCRTERLFVQFRPAIDPDGHMATISPPWNADYPIWSREGETFEKLTISPSVDASNVKHWHGFITNGQIVGGI